MIFADIADIDRRYEVIYADPPWKYMPDIGDRRIRRGGVTVKAEKSLRPNSSPDVRYATMSPTEIEMLDVRRICAPNARLFLWCPASLTPHVGPVMNAWGFKFSTLAYNWIKVSRRTGKPVTGQGFSTLSGSELCWTGLRGSLRRESRTERQVVHAIKREHSRKPDEVRESIRRMYGGRPMIELFCRGRPMDGWDGHGDQCGDGKA